MIDKENLPHVSGSRIMVILLFALILVPVVSATFSLSYTENVGVAFGEVQQEESDLEIQDVETIGDGLNVDDVELQVENTGDADLDGEFDVSLLDGSTEVTSGSTSQVIDEGDTDPVTVSLDSSTEEPDFDSIEIEIEDEEV